jgi:hypothetical protein
MRKFFGTALILGGVLSLADFLIWGSLNAHVEGQARSSHLFLPMLATGLDFPTAVSKLCFGLGLFVFGLYLVLLEGDMGRCPLSLIFMLNALVLCFSLLVAFAASQNPEKHAYVGIASISALLSVVGGLVLLYFAATERPVGKAGLSLGSIIYVSSAALGAVVFLSGKAA